MNNSVKIIFTFAIGAAVGVVATQKFFKAKYATIAQEEIDSVKEVYSKRKINEEIHEDADDYYIDPEKVDEYEHIINKQKYSKNEEKGGSEKAMIKHDKNVNIEVVPPDEFGQIDEYDLISITYYANGILTDDGDEPIEDIEGTIGPDALDSFGEWEDDTVYVRNDDRGCYYEICRDYSDYHEPTGADE